MFDNPSHHRKICLVDAFSLLISMYYVQIFLQDEYLFGNVKTWGKNKGNLRITISKEICQSYFN